MILNTNVFLVKLEIKYNDKAIVVQFARLSCYLYGVIFFQFFYYFKTDLMYNKVKKNL